MAWRDSAGRKITPTCKQGVRHWFAVHGAVGLRSPTCVRCNAPNPKPLTPEELAEYNDWMRS